MSVTIWIDADACPLPAKEVIFKAAQRTGNQVEVVANSFQRLPALPHFRLTVVGKGFDEADHYITARVVANDIVVTADVPLAHAVVTKGAHGINPRGELYTAANIGEKLATRNLMADLRGGDLVRGGPAAYGAHEKKHFAQAFDRTLTRAIQDAARVRP